MKTTVLCRKGGKKRNNEPFCVHKKRMPNPPDPNFIGMKGKDHP